MQTICSAFLSFFLSFFTFFSASSNGEAIHVSISKYLKHWHMQQFTTAIRVDTFKKLILYTLTNLENAIVNPIMEASKKTKTKQYCLDNA